MQRKSIQHNFVYLEKHLPEHNMHRYYRLYITTTLFGSFALIREWGRCSSRKVGYSGSLMQHWFSSIEEAQLAKENLVILKKEEVTRLYSSINDKICSNAPAIQSNGEHCKALIVEAGFISVEQITLDRINKAVNQYRNTNLRSRLEKYHGENWRPNLKPGQKHD